MVNQIFKSKFWIFSTVLFGTSLFFFHCITPTKEVVAKEATTKKRPSFNNGSKVVRGVNVCPLDADKIRHGNSPKVGVNEPLTDLSVNASPDNNTTYAELARGLPNANYSFTTLGDLRKANKHIQIVQVPLLGNPYHCQISVITPKEMASRMSKHCR